MNTFNLDNEPKIESGFKIPDGYFDTFSAKVLEQLHEEEPKVISIFQKYKTAGLMVAAIFLLALMVPFLNTTSTNTKELDQSTLENYLAYQTNLTQYDLISELESSDISKIQTTTSADDQIIEDLLTTNADIEQLIIE